MRVALSLWLVLTLLEVQEPGVSQDVAYTFWYITLKQALLSQLQNKELVPVVCIHASQGRNLPLVKMNSRMWFRAVSG